MITMQSHVYSLRADADEVAVVAVTFSGRNHVEIPAEVLAVLATKCVVVRADGTTVKCGIECAHSEHGKNSLARKLISNYLIIARFPVCIHCDGLSVYCGAYSFCFIVATPQHSHLAFD